MGSPVVPGTHGGSEAIGDVNRRPGFSVTARMNPAVTMAIAAIPDDAWTTLKYRRAVSDEQEQR